MYIYFLLALLGGICALCGFEMGAKPLASIMPIHHANVKPQTELYHKRTLGRVPGKRDLLFSTYKK